MAIEPSLRSSLGEIVGSQYCLRLCRRMLGDALSSYKHIKLMEKVQRALITDGNLLWQSSKLLPSDLEAPL